VGRLEIKVDLTSSAIEWMIPRMCRRVLAALLILGWVSLSGFDVVEDLDEVPGQVAVSSSSTDNSSTSKRGGWGHLANNIIESANRIQQLNSALVSFRPTIFNFDPVPVFRRHFQLHKLYRVFLI
jgi:hypothetical protein